MKRPYISVLILGGMALLGVFAANVFDVLRPEITPIEVIETMARSLVVTEVGPLPANDTHAFIEFLNVSDAAVEMAGYVVVTGPETEFTIGDGRAVVEPGGHLLMWLDGSTPAPVFVDESVTIIHGPQYLSDPWEPSFGQLLLRSPEGRPVTCVVWGGPAIETVRIPGVELLWRPEWFVQLHDSFGLYEVRTPIASGASIGLYPHSGTNQPGDWAVYDRTTVSPGAINPVPQPGAFTTPDGSAVDGGAFSLAWKGQRSDGQYKYQLAADKDFSPLSIIDEGTVETPHYEPLFRLTPGAYFFRVHAVARHYRGDDENEQYGRPLRFFAAPTPSDATSVVLKMDHLIQHKDTALICLDGCGQEVGAAATKHWRASHPNTPPLPGDHGDEYCGRASVAMVVSNYGKALSQDRIAMYTDEELCMVSPVPDGCSDQCWRAAVMAPEGDLAHDRPIYCPLNGVDCPPVTWALQWALNTAVDFVPCEDTNPATPSNKCDNVDGSDIVSWIDAGRPVLARLQIPHFVAINGYSKSPGGVDVLIHDPMETSPGWHVFNSAEYKGFWLGPPTAPAARSDQTSWYQDSDADGIVDFDEINRFPTDPKNADTDGDAVSDLNDVRECVFAADGSWARGETYSVVLGSGTLTFQRIPDFDGDSLRKEVDADNDNDGCLDGVEDANRNGVYEAASGESNNFVAPDCEPKTRVAGCRCR